MDTDMTNRRVFLTKLGSVLAVPTALSMAGCTNRADEGAMPDTTAAAARTFDDPIGVQLYSVRNELGEDLEGTLQAVKQAGVDLVETYSLHDLTAADYRSLLDEVGLQVESMHVQYDQAVNETAVVAEQAKTLGSPWVVVPWIPHEGEFTPEDMNRAIDEFTTAGRALRDEGLRFAYHVHGYEFHEAEDGGTLFDRFMEETEPGVVDVQMDVFWVVWPGHDPVALLEKYPGRFPSLHIKDMRQDVTEGDLSGQAPHDAQVPIGEGRIDYPSILQAAKAGGTELYFIEYEHTSPLQAIESSLNYLRTVEL